MEFQTYNIVNEQPRTIRALARQALQGRWTEAFILLLVVTAIQQVPGSLIDSIAKPGSILGFIASIYSLLIGGPLAMGVAYYFIKLFLYPLKHGYIKIHHEPDNRKENNYDNNKNKSCPYIYRKCHYHGAEHYERRSQKQSQSKI